MSAWLETLGVTLLVLGGVALGRWFSRLPKWYWALGYLLPLGLLIGVGLPNWWHRLCFVPPFSWLTAGRTEYALAGLITTLILTTPLSRLSTARLRGLVVTFMVLVVVMADVLPFLGPALVRGSQSRLLTKVDGDGVCLQSNSYNCGPAAAVTALRRLGLPAAEGEMAILAHTSPVGGTAPDVLAEAIARRYGPQGLSAEYRYFGTVAELKGAGEVLAVIKYAFMVDHYVAVLQVTDDAVVVGDPLKGKQTWTHAEFRSKWRCAGVVLRRP
jgi:uncharacterized protein